MACTSNAENFMKIARIVYQLCDYTHFRADFLQTRICGKWLIFANQVTYTPYLVTSCWITLCLVISCLIQHVHHHTTCSSGTPDCIKASMNGISPVSSASLRALITCRMVSLRYCRLRWKSSWRWLPGSGSLPSFIRIWRVEWQWVCLSAS